MIASVETVMSKLFVVKSLLSSEAVQFVFLIHNGKADPGSAHQNI